MAVVAVLVVALCAGVLVGGPAAQAAPAQVSGMVLFKGTTTTPTPAGRRALDLLAAWVPRGATNVSVTVTGWAEARRTTRAVLVLSDRRTKFVQAELRRRGLTTASFTLRVGGRHPLRGAAGRRADVTISAQTAAPTTSTTSTSTTTTTLPESVAAVTAGSGHSCAVTTYGRGFCWGFDFYGQLGNNSTSNSSVAVQVSDPTLPSAALSGISKIAAGGFHTCAVMVDTTARCWGRNSNGQLGNNTSSDSSLPVTVLNPANPTSPLTGVSSISAGLIHTCALMVDGTARCWGANGSGQLGDGGTAASSLPVKVVDPANVAQPLGSLRSINLGDEHSCATATSSGNVYCWGKNFRGQLGNGTTTDSSVAVLLLQNGSTTPVSGVVAVAGGGAHTCVLLGGYEMCAGSNASGQLGDGTTTHSVGPVSVLYPGPSAPTTNLGPISSITEQTSSSCAAMVDTTAYCWGANYYGGLGNNTMTNSTTAVRVLDPTNRSVPLTGVTQLDGGSYHVCAVVSGRVMCWGKNGTGQLGNSTTTDSSVPVVVQGLP